MTVEEQLNEALKLLRQGIQILYKLQNGDTPLSTSVPDSSPSSSPPYSSSTSIPEMPFGKHKGVPLNELPELYVNWLLNQDFVQEQWPIVYEYLSGQEPEDDDDDEHPSVSPEVPF